MKLQYERRRSLSKKDDSQWVLCGLVTVLLGVPLALYWVSVWYLNTYGS